MKKGLPSTNEVCKPCTNSQDFSFKPFWKFKKTHFESAYLLSGTSHLSFVTCKHVVEITTLQYFLVTEQYAESNVMCSQKYCSTEKCVVWNKF